MDNSHHLKNTQATWRAATSIAGTAGWASGFAVQMPVGAHIGAGDGMMNSSFPNDAATSNETEERRRMEQKRQQQKLRQTFEMSQKKGIKPEDLIKKISLDLGPSEIPPKRPQNQTVVPAMQEKCAAPCIPSFEMDMEIPDVAFKGSSKPHPAELMTQKKPDISEMMLKFSDLSATGKGKAQFTPSSNVQQPKRTSPEQRTANFATSSSARDWKDIPLDISSAFAEAPKPQEQLSQTTSITSKPLTNGSAALFGFPLAEPVQATLPLPKSVPTFSSGAMDDDDFADFVAAPTNGKSSSDLSSLNGSFAKFSSANASAVAGFPSANAQLPFSGMSPQAPSIPTPPISAAAAKSSFDELLDLSAPISHSLSTPTPGSDLYAALRDLSFDSRSLDTASSGTKQDQFVDLSLELNVSPPDLRSASPLAENRTPFDDRTPDSTSVCSLELSGAPRLQLDGIETPNRSNRSSPTPPAESVMEPAKTLDIVSQEEVIKNFLNAIQTCILVMRDMVGVFNSIRDSVTLKEVIKEADKTVRGVIEIYRVGRRIALASKANGLLHNVSLLNALADMEEVWGDLVVFFNLAAIEVHPSTLEFHRLLLKPPRQLDQSCGVCTLNVDDSRKTPANPNDVIKVEVDGRFYHVACANFWINLIHDDLPRLFLPE